MGNTDIEKRLQSILGEIKTEKRKSPPSPLPVDLHLDDSGSQHIIDISEQDISMIQEEARPFLDAASFELQKIQNFVQERIDLMLMKENIGRIPRDARRIHLVRECRNYTHYVVLRDNYNPRDKNLTITLQDVQDKIRYVAKITLFPEGDAEPILHLVKKMEELSLDP